MYIFHANKYIMDVIYELPNKACGYYPLQINYLLSMEDSYIKICKRMPLDTRGLAFFNREYKKNT